MICNDLDGPKQRRAAAILSRAPKLDDKYYQLMREHLSKYSMEEEDLTPIFKCDWLSSWTEYGSCSKLFKCRFCISLNVKFYVKYFFILQNSN